MKYPAGLDLGGTEPPEIALSILAELVQVRAERAGARGEGRPGAPPGAAGESASGAAAGAAASDAGTDAGAPQAPAFATDPVCGMSVEVEEARHTAEWRGRAYYFCCPGCRRSFEEDPGAYADAEAE
ncbi:MAG: YHS domain-containing protein [Gemmatimonadetes bacterium]|nr:YHS domain-containing protein [Gemmatimonadota bacterium]NIR79839.1 YHS domain-containing protein [Gemmatimonadota bacterium]NIT88554.1 YHS domain-containing protein [Gemmatimonadota bacterium]NIU32374.1 YHS domain-containing protein [Gemmatimonadota bacterium]NIV62731.1 YHS domain-containing protein [Gemmatimonadota bacterium]